ncbi:carboxymuconolactone decarboxylase family protein [Kerstersia gyiorum]|uniref:carboxymuconolactone decarboxylase family protein n=1 Tax=Kerstersia gyiorum TaxID=206506 RepID=UPI0030B97DD7
MSYPFFQFLPLMNRTLAGQNAQVKQTAAPTFPFCWRYFMKPLRLPYQTLSPEAYQGLTLTKKALDQSSLGKPLIELIYLRVSQMNGCAFCLEMHAASLRAAGVPDKKLDGLAGWRVSPSFSERERSALARAESLVNVAQSHASDTDFEQLNLHFNDQEISDLSFAIALMSAFNRLAIGMRQ